MNHNFKGITEPGYKNTFSISKNEAITIQTELLDGLWLVIIFYKNKSENIGLIEDDGNHYIFHPYSSEISYTEDILNFISAALKYLNKKGQIK